MVEINDVLVAAPDATTLIEGFNRLVNVDHQGAATLIRLDELDVQGESIVLTAPFRVRLHELLHEIREGRILVGQEFDCGLPPTVELLKEPARKIFTKNLEIINALINPEDGDPDARQHLFNPEDRGRMFKKVAKKFGISHRSVRRLYYQYLWGGQTELALAPRIEGRGGKGKKQKDGTGRRGRKANDADAGQIPLPIIRELLEKGANLFYLPGALTLEEAFMETKKRYFRKGAKVNKDDDAPINEILLPPKELPTIRQFRYVSEKLQKIRGKTKIIPRRIRQKTAPWEFRGRSRDGVPGPGYRFEIDSTIVQIRPVSRFNRARILKEVTLYIIIDVWSGAIVGYALSLHKASWALAAKALLNCFSDKQEVFDRLGLGYTSEDWPCHHLPSRLAADRGEMVSDKADRVPEIGTKVEIMPPMCPERKGGVEAGIKNIKHGHSHHLPGRHPKFRRRREPDGSDTASLTVEELEKIVVEIIMGLNHAPVPAEHIPPELIESGWTDVSYIGLFKWGIEHLPGFTRKLTKTEVYTNLMSKGVAKLTDRGLSFKCQNFISPNLHNAIANKRRSGKGRPLVDIRYDEHRAKAIWFLNRETDQWVEALNDNPDIQRREGAFYELEILRDEITKLRRAVKDENLHQEGKRRERVKKIVKGASEEAKEAKKGVSKAGRKKDISGATDLDKAAAEFIASGATAPAPVPPLSLPAPPATPPSEQLPVQEPTEVQKTAPRQFPPTPPQQQSIAEISRQLWRSQK